MHMTQDIQFRSTESQLGQARSIAEINSSFIQKGYTSFDLIFVKVNEREIPFNRINPWLPLDPRGWPSV